MSLKQIKHFIFFALLTTLKTSLLACEAIYVALLWSLGKLNLTAEILETLISPHLLICFSRCIPVFSFITGIFQLSLKKSPFLAARNKLLLRVCVT